ncbi:MULTISPECIES: hypothetical protein [Pseudomonas]|nr:MULTISPECIES: hypothetical protein [Pseudomonas]WLH19180.1 hypothetical protein PSH75_03650 [Pseudomonas simiae]
MSQQYQPTSEKIEDEFEMELIELTPEEIAYISGGYGGGGGSKSA